MRSISRRLDTGIFERAPRGVGGQARRRLAFAGDVAAANAGALDDPLVGGVDRLRQFFIVDAALGKRGTGSSDDGTQGHWAASLQRVGAEIVEIVADLPGDVVADHARGDADGVGDALRVRAAVALHDQAVEAEEDRAVMVVGVEMDLEQVERRAATARSRPSTGASS